MAELKCQWARCGERAAARARLVVPHPGYKAFTIRPGEAFCDAHLKRLTAAVYLKARPQYRPALTILAGMRSTAPPDFDNATVEIDHGQ